MAAIAVLASSCGQPPSSDADPQDAASERAADKAEVVRPAGQASAGAMDALPGLDGPEAAAAAPPATQADASDIAKTGREIAGLIGGGGGSAPEGPMTAGEAMAVLAELGRPGMELTEEQAARLQAANDTLYGARGSQRRQEITERVADAIGDREAAARLREAIRANEPPDWALPAHEERGGEAELIVRVGDIDNLGFGWPADFDPFSGASTPPHAFPWRPDRSDPPGTDRIMVVSGFQRDASTRMDGYTETTRRPGNAVKPISLRFDPAGLTIRAARLQMFVDDFQAPSFGTVYRLSINAEELAYASELLNTLRQGGPVGKMVTVEILPEHLGLLASGDIELLIDDPYTNAGDGFAIDFVRLLINPGDAVQVGTIAGRVTDADTGAALPGALVSASGVVEAITGAEGLYRLDGVPAGLPVLTASHPDYEAASESRELLAGGTEEADFALKPRNEAAEAIGKTLDETGRVDLYGILFDTNEATIRPESEETLQAVLDVLTEREALSVTLTGHTDSVGSDSANLGLSQRRAAAVAAWLIDRGVDEARIASSGAGEGRPVASNETEQGRARNRRVELAVRR